MKKIITAVAVIVLLVIGYNVLKENGPELAKNLETLPNSVGTSTKAAQSTDIPAVTVIAKNLEIPWDIAFLPDGNMLVTERPGRLILLSKDGVKLATLFEQSKLGGEGGMLGVTLHPNFASNHFVYLYMGTPVNSTQTVNKVVRYIFEDNKLTENKVIITGIPGALYHDGGRMEFGPDGLLYITTGDATDSSLAPKLPSLAGKILRVTDDGSTPANNSFGTRVYSYGHRNPQGLAWDTSGRLWETEHGRTSGSLTGFDELNLITAGKNYGWPDSEGPTVKSGTVGPVKHSGATTTWAPASLTYLNGSLFYGGLKGEALYEAVLDGASVKEIKTHFKSEFGRIRTTRVGPDGMLYITTSNRDGRGTSKSEDDKIIRINPAKL